MREIDIEFSSVTFENTLSKLLIMFNQKLQNGADIQKFIDELIAAKNLLEINIWNQAPGNK